MEPSLARTIEDASLRAWPALETEELDGWLLRYANGFTKRSNSVQPFSASTLPLHEKVEACEGWYTARGLPAMFRLSRFSDPELDALLARRSYAAVEPTLVLSMPLGAATPVGPNAGVREVELDDWLGCYGVLSELAGGPPPTMKAILEACDQDRLCGVLFDDGGAEPVACGLAVADGALVGLFDLVTAASRRRSGFGTTLITGLLDWGLAEGASRAYLQVVRSNVPARALYKKLGFEPIYEYWYRVQPGPRGHTTSSGAT